MVGETNLNVLLSSMRAELIDGTFVFVTGHSQQIPATIRPRMVFEEAEGPTYILLKHDADAAAIDYEFPCRMITLQIHSSLEAVGFLARITTALAKAGMGVNPVSGFYHDHLFVPDGREAEAMEILRALTAGK